MHQHHAAPAGPKKVDEKVLANPEVVAASAAVETAKAAYNASHEAVEAAKDKLKAAETTAAKETLTSALKEARVVRNKAKTDLELADFNKDQAIVKASTPAPPKDPAAE